MVLDNLWKLLLNPFTPKSDLIDFTLSNANYLKLSQSGTRQPVLRQNFACSFTVFRVFTQRPHRFQALWTVMWSSSAFTYETI